MMNRLAVTALAMIVASCGRVADLEPAAGQSLPQKPALASRPLDADQLLKLPPNAAPKRVDELNKKGEVRTADRFDLPPAEGASAPAPGETGEAATPSTTGPDNQDIPR